MAGPRYKQFTQPDAGSSFVQVGDTALGGNPGDISGGDSGNDFHYDAILDLLNLTGSVTIGGDLTVQGTTITIGSQIQVADRYLLMNSEYTAAPALDAGLVINVDPSATSFPIGGIATNVITASSGDPSASLGVGDFVLVQNPATAGNAGIYEVLSTTASTLTIDVTPVHAWSNTSITDDATVQGTVVGIKLSIIRASMTGALETATGTAAPLTFGISFDGSTGVGTLSSSINIGTGITPSLVNGTIVAGDGNNGLLYDPVNGRVNCNQNSAATTGNLGGAFLARRTTSGAPAIGIAVKALEAVVERVGAEVSALRLDAVLTDVGAGTCDSDIDFYLLQNDAPVRILRLRGDDLTTELTGSFALGSSVGGAFAGIQHAVIELTGLTGATATAVGLIPAGSMVLGVTARVNTLITGATTFDIGDGTDVDRWGAAIALAATTTSDPTDFTDNTLSWSGAAASDVVLTANGPNFTAGAVRLVVTYMSLTAPTS